jgi:hypothetical protein
MKIVDLKLAGETRPSDFSNYLSCPVCGGESLHHVSVEVFNGHGVRGGIHVLVKGNTVITDTDMSMNPSLDRDGLLIRFYCETCPATPTLMLRQHKGTSYIDFYESPV